MQIRQPVNVLEPFLYICNTYRVNMVVFFGFAVPSVRCPIRQEPYTAGPYQDDEESLE